jgi:hypothetical protein
MPFLWGKFGDRSASSLLTVCYAGLLTFFKLCNVIWLWMLFTGSGDELCGLLSALFQAAAYHPPTFSSSAFSEDFQSLFTASSHVDQLLVSPPFLVHSKHPIPSAVCPFQFLIYYCFFFFCGVEVSLAGELWWFNPKVVVEIQHAVYFLTSLSASPKKVWIQHLPA